MLRDYWQLAKPGITGGNVAAAGAGFLLAAGRHADRSLLAATLAGIALVIAAACVLNNVLDRKLDRRMARTRMRVLARGHMRPRTALLYAAVLEMAGFVILLARANALAVGIVLAGFAVYVGVYTLYLKRRSTWATAVGSLAGAAPPVAGYCAACGRFDAGAAWLGAVFCLWQVAHFHAIAIRRVDDYRAAAVPVLAASVGVRTAQRHMVACILAFVVLTQWLPGLGGASYAYHALVAAAGLAWLYVAWRGNGAGRENRTVDSARWARRAFIGSLAALAVLGAMLSVAALAAIPR